MTKNADLPSISTRRSYRRILWALLILSMLATAFFAVRGVVQFVYWSDRAHRNQALEPWMPLGFVARSYDVEQDALAAALEVSPGANRGVPLEDLAETRGQEFEAFAREVMAVIQDLRSR